MPPEAAPLGLVAGTGDLPRRLAEACRAQGRPLFVLALKGVTDPALAATAPHAWVKLGAVGTALDTLRGAGVREIVLAGPVPRPSFGSLGLDLRTLRLLADAGRGGLGDDGLLSMIVRELEREGFNVVAPEAVLGGLAAAVGPLGRVVPDAGQEADIALGLRVTRALGALDVGQAAVVQGGRVLGVEAAEGTDALIARCAGLGAGRGGVLVKAAKPQQERRVDLPAIGPGTVAAAARAGLAGIAVEAGASLIIDAAATREAADTAGLFVVAVPVP